MSKCRELEHTSRLPLIPSSNFLNTVVSPKLSLFNTLYHVQSRSTVAFASPASNFQNKHRKSRSLINKLLFQGSFPAFPTMPPKGPHLEARQQVVFPE